MREESDTRDAAAARVASGQHGVVTAEQLSEAGLDKSAVARRVAAGRLHRLHRGVYAVGHRGVSLEGQWMAAVLASGAGAALSHGSAAVHWGLLRPLSGPVDVSVPTRAGRAKRAGIRTHRRQILGRSDVTCHRGIPVTVPARTVADLEGAVPARLARRARRQAEMLGLPLGEIPTDGTGSDLERDFLRLCRRHALPLPEVNVRVGRWTVDFLWPACRLVVETDGYLYHRGAVAFEDDRERDLGLRVLGYDVLRFTGRHVSAEPERVAALVGEALRSRAD